MNEELDSYHKKEKERMEKIWKELKTPGIYPRAKRSIVFNVVDHNIQDMKRDLALLYPKLKVLFDVVGANHYLDDYEKIMDAVQLIHEQ